MRMRKKKHGAERISECSDLLTENPVADFDSDKKLMLEIGCGKGRFVCMNAAIYPQYNYLAIEKISDVILLAMERAKREGLSNVKFINCDAKILGNYLPQNSVDVIFLNFNDPWPKKGYYKRRLTYTDFLNIYKSFLKPGGEIRLKTDNEDYFNFSLEMFEQNGFEVHDVTRDLHNSGIYNAQNICTEYEKNFSEKGIPINRAVAVLKA